MCRITFSYEEMYSLYKQTNVAPEQYPWGSVFASVVVLLIMWIKKKKEESFVSTEVAWQPNPLTPVPHCAYPLWLALQRVENDWQLFTQPYSLCLCVCVCVWFPKHGFATVATTTACTEWRTRGQIWVELGCTRDFPHNFIMPVESDRHGRQAWIL